MKPLAQKIRHLEQTTGLSKPEHPLRRLARRTGLARMRKRRQHSDIRPEDAFIDSYPRSGNTWTRFVLTQVLLSTEVGFREAQMVIPRVGLHQHAPGLLPGGGRLLKTHEQYRPEYRKAVHLLRDPRDMALSYRRFLAAFGHKYPEGKFIENLVDGSIGTNGTWLEHTESWLAARERGARVHAVTYEQLRASPVDHFSAIASFLGIEATREEVARAVEENTTDSMRSKEADLGRPVSGKSWKSSQSFIGKGKVGGWQDEFTVEELEPLKPSVELYEAVARELDAKSSAVKDQMLQ